MKVTNRQRETLGSWVTQRAALKILVDGLLERSVNTSFLLLVIFWDPGRALPTVLRMDRTRMKRDTRSQ
ncbi:hypothetical protein ABZ490_38660 [Streptomyces sp. NPDC005811]|uniref:hypothetical protein n=1 Tax=Streptomyces sp. NPDC005811 TaxID=3154565 RepID=UPI0033FEF51F